MGDTLTGRLAQLAPKTPAVHAAANYDAAKDRPAPERWVTMSNALTRAGHGLTLSEKRIVMMALSRLDSRKYVGRAAEVPTTRITAVEYAEAFDVDSDTAYKQLKEASKHLYGRSITFFEAAHRRRGKELTPTKVQMRWVGSIKYQEGEGWVELAWWPHLMQHLTGLKKQFTTYQLQQTTALRSAYSWKLLELLMRFEDSGRAEYTIEDFSTSMDATEKQRANFANIRRRIIEPAVHELGEKDGWDIQWRPIKAGRRVAKVRFDFKRQEQLRLPID